MQMPFSILLRSARTVAFWATCALAAFTGADRAFAAPGQPATPHELFGPLYEAVQTAHIYPDAKTFADAVPRDDPQAILAAYAKEKPADDAALKAFVERHFILPAPPKVTLRQHIASLWPVLTRGPDNSGQWSSAIPLPAPYVVPGGRFREIYYWDSYFTMLGLRADKHSDLVTSMLTDFRSLVDRFGFIPNGTRTYYLSRSQPPFFAAMAQLQPLTGQADDAALLDALKTEHRFWMRGTACLPKQGAGACERVVRLSDGTVLNRYWDARNTPRDEALGPDLATARDAKRPRPQLFRNLRAAAESGWDFSSRWLDDPLRLSSIITTSVVPVDLNSLLYQLEREIERRCRAAADNACASSYLKQAETRARGVQQYLWSPTERRFADYDIRKSARTPVLSAATYFPLWVGIATQEQAAAVAETTRELLLASGGLRTTQIRTGQQWDAPNGWAPLQWIAIDGLARYNEAELAHEIARRWINTVDRTWGETGRMLEKYDVEEQKIGGGGEYETQDGFGWTNGVTAAILERYPDLEP
jgi:alpha,alpha-trehalase